MKTCFKTTAFIFFVLLGAGIASAQEYDTLHADYQFAFNITDPVNALGVPDQSMARLNPVACELDVAFIDQSGTMPRTLKAGANLTIYCMKDNAVDSSGATVTLIRALPDQTILYQSDPIPLTDGINTIAATDKEYTYLAFSLTEGSMGFFIDAVRLIQEADKVSVHFGDKVFASHITSNYPNPFYSTDGTTLVFTTEQTANVEAQVIDAMGREISLVSQGTLDAGEHTVQLFVPESGVYFVRLIIDGTPGSNVYRLTAR